MIKKLFKKFAIPVILLALSIVFALSYYNKVTILEKKHDYLKNELEEMQLEINSQRETETILLKEENLYKQKENIEDSVAFLNKTIYKNEIEIINAKNVLLNYDDKIEGLQNIVELLTINEYEIVVDKRFPYELIDVIKTHFRAIEEGSETLLESTLYNGTEFEKEKLYLYFNENKNNKIIINKIVYGTAMSYTESFYINVAVNNEEFIKVVVIYKDNEWKIGSYD